MGRRKQVAGLKMLLLSTCLVAGAAASAIPLPETATDRILYAQISDSHISQSALMVGRRTFIWGAGQPLRQPTIFATYYYPSNRDFDRSHTLAWYKKNHPDWVAYRCDKGTPAYDNTYGWGAYVPLDITRPDVRGYILQTFLAPAIARGFDGIAYDNVSIENGAHRCGVWHGTQWVQQFDGKSRDDRFAAAMLDYIGWVREEVHERGAALALNAKLDTEQEALSGRLIALSDIWLDEGGFSDGCAPVVVDRIWHAKFHMAYQKARESGYVSMNTLCQPFSQVEAQEASWIIANFLLIRGARSYLAVLGAGEAGRLLDYSERWNPPVGSPVGPPRSVGPLFVRDYAHGLVVVNPSSRAPASFDLPPGAWSSSAAHALTGPVELPPRSGLVLLRR
jgi:hypothetical protein